MRSPDTNLSSLEIILIDRDLGIHMSLTPPLLAAGFRVESYLDGSSALPAIDAQQAACVLLDINATDHVGVQLWKSSSTRLI